MRKLHTKFGTVTLSSPEQLPVSVFSPAPACTSVAADTERNQCTGDELFKQSCVGLSIEQQKELHLVTRVH